MPVFCFNCKKCDIQALLLRNKAPDPPTCEKCHKAMVRITKGATSRITEVLDNGLMTRKVERPAEAERLFKERADADQKRRNGQ